MEAYKLLAELNRKEAFSEKISDSEKRNAVSIFLDSSARQEEVMAYKKRMRTDPGTDAQYPLYFLPPYNGGKKLRLVQGYLPKTNLLYANHYELEILRLLHKFAPENQTVRDMGKHTYDRLQKTCFGSACAQGECMAAGISVLRFLAAAFSEEREWIDDLVTALGEQFLSIGNGQAAVQNGLPLSYLLMAFTDVNNEKTRELISRKKEWLLDLLRRGWITGKLSNGKISEGDTYNLMVKHILRNALGTLPEYADIAKHTIYVDPSDERCYCDI